MWAVGVVMFQMLTGAAPFKDETEKGLYKKIQRGSYSEPVNQRGEPLSQAANDLIKRLLCLDPHTRISASQCL